MKIEKISAEYVTHSGDDLLVVDAARASFNKTSEYDENGDLKSGDQNLITFLGTGFRTSEWQELINNIGLCQDMNQIEEWLRNLQLTPQHWAPFAHPHLTLRMTIPIFLARQFMKHQVGFIWSEESRRYISSPPSFWFPRHVHTRPADIKQGSGDRHKYDDYWVAMMIESSEKALALYMDMIQDGVAPEEARIVLPLNHMTTVMWTGSLLGWSRVANQRMDGHAQRAANELAQRIRDVVKVHYPYAWAVLTNGK